MSYFLVDLLDDFLEGVVPLFLGALSALTVLKLNNNGFRGVWVLSVGRAHVEW